MASESPSLSTIYLTVGYDEYWGMVFPSRIGCCTRVLKMQDGTWNSIDIDY